MSKSPMGMVIGPCSEKKAAAHCDRRPAARKNLFLPLPSTNPISVDLSSMDPTPSRTLDKIAASTVMDCVQCPRWLESSQEAGHEWLGTTRFKRLRNI